MSTELRVAIVPVPVAGQDRARDHCRDSEGNGLVPMTPPAQ
jgi:hypothetical protein